MIYYAIISLYLLALLWIGYQKSDSVKTQEDFSVAGRSLSPWILVGTMAATWMGTGSILGNAGKTFEVGAAGFLLPIGGMLGILVLINVSGKARASKKLTVPQIIGDRFGDVAMILSVIALLAAYLVIVSYQFNAGGAVLYTIFNDNLGSSISLDQSTIIAAIFIIAYTILAGLLSVAYTDVANGILMITCFVIAFPILLFQAGGFEGMNESFLAKGLPNQMSPFKVFTFREILNFCLPSFLLILGDANMYQRFFASESVKSARKATFILFFAVVILESLIVANAWVSSSMIVDIEKQSHVLIYAAYNFLPPLLGSIMLATLIGVIVSTADSFLLVPTTVIINDLYMKYSKNQFSEKSIILISRSMVLLLGIFAYFVSRMFAADTTIFEKSLYAFTIYGTSITPSLLASFFWEKASRLGAIFSILSGIVSTIYFGNLSGLDAAVVPSLSISASVLVLFSLIENQIKK